MTDSELRQVKERAKNLESVAKNLELEIATIGALMRHMLADLGDETNAAKLRAAVVIGEGIQRIAETYR